MPRMLTRCAVFIALTLIPVQAVTDPAPVTHLRQVTEDFAEADLIWSSHGPGFELRWRTFALDGKIGICGVVHYPSASTRKQSEALLRRAYIIYEDKKIMRDLSFFTVVPRRNALSSATAQCAQTPVDAPEKWTVQLNWDRRRDRF